jgi:antitoxin component of MazEF toxin-antitoxin module
MKVKVAKWGNSLGVRLPKAAVETAGVSAGTELELTVEGRGFRLRGMGKTSAQRLQELLDQIDPNNIPEMIDWGPDRGAEIIDDDYSRGLIVPGPDGSPVRTDGPQSESQAGKRDARSRRR